MHRPRGFTFLAAVLAILLPAQVIALLARGPAGGESVAEPVLELLLVALTAVAAEALWRVRPWATRACGVLAAVAMLLLALRFDGAGSPVAVMTRLANVMLLGVILVFAVVCVHHTLEHLLGGPRPRYRRTAPRISRPVPPRGVR
ncbi:MAG TPA: hypothetical protein VF092_27060 [Longimicrobium sp.]